MHYRAKKPSFQTSQVVILHWISVALVLISPISISPADRTISWKRWRSRETTTSICRIERFVYHHQIMLCSHLQLAHPWYHSYSFIHSLSLSRWIHERWSRWTERRKWTIDYGFVGKVSNSTMVYISDTWLFSYFYFFTYWWSVQGSTTESIVRNGSNITESIDNEYTGYPYGRKQISCCGTTIVIINDGRWSTRNHDK